MNSLDSLPKQTTDAAKQSKLREAKPGGFQTRVFPTFFGKGPDCVADPFGTVPRRFPNPPAPYRAQSQENLEIPFSESKNTVFDPQHGTYLNGHFGAFNSPLLYELLH